MSFAPEIRGNKVLLPFKAKDGSKQEASIKYSKTKGAFGRGGHLIEVTFSKDGTNQEKPLYLNKVQLEAWINDIGQGMGALTSASSQVRGRLISQYAGCKTLGPKTPAKPETEKNRALSPGAIEALFEDEGAGVAASPQEPDVDTVDDGSNRSDTPPRENVDAASSDNDDSLQDAEAPTPVVPRSRSPQGAGAPPKVQSLSFAAKAKIAAAAVLVTSVALGAIAVYLDPTLIFEPEVVIPAPRTVDSLWEIESVDDAWLYLGY